MKNFPRLLAATAVAFLGTASAYVGTASASKPNPNNGLTTARPDSGAPNSGVVTDSSGQIIKYGSSSISYQTPAQLLGVSQAQLEHLGKALYMQNCSSCHGEAANGVPYAGTPGAYPNLVGLGPAVVDFWIESGRMPAANPTTVQAGHRGMGELAAGGLPARSAGELVKREHLQWRRLVRTELCGLPHHHRWWRCLGKRHVCAELAQDSEEPSC